MTVRPMVFTLVTAAATTGRRLKGKNQLFKAIRSETFTNGAKVTNAQAQRVA